MSFGPQSLIIFGCRAVKLPRFGYSLMDVGTGSIIFSSGVPDLWHLWLRSSTENRDAGIWNPAVVTLRSSNIPRVLRRSARCQSEVPHVTWRWDAMSTLCKLPSPAKSCDVLPSEHDSKTLFRREAWAWRPWQSLSGSHLTYLYNSIHISHFQRSLQDHEALVPALVACGDVKQWQMWQMWQTVPSDWSQRSQLWGQCFWLASCAQPWCGALPGPQRSDAKRSPSIAGFVSSERCDLASEDYHVPPGEYGSRLGESSAVSAFTYELNYRQSFLDVACQSPLTGLSLMYLLYL